MFCRQCEDRVIWRKLFKISASRIILCIPYSTEHRRMLGWLMLSMWSCVLTTGLWHSQIGSKDQTVSSQWIFFNVFQPKNRWAYDSLIKVCFPCFFSQILWLDIWKVVVCASVCTFSKQCAIAVICSWCRLCQICSVVIVSVDSKLALPSVYSIWNENKHSLIVNPSRDVTRVFHGPSSSFASQSGKEPHSNYRCCIQSMQHLEE